MNASTSFSLIIYSFGANVFLCIHTEALFTLLKRDNATVTKVLFPKVKRKINKTLCHTCTPYTVLSNTWFKHRLYPWITQDFFRVCAWRKNSMTLFFPKQICIKVYGDYQCKHGLTVDPLPVSAIRGPILDIFKHLEYYCNNICNCDGSHI